MGNHYGPSTGDLEHCLYLGNNVTGHTGDQFVGAIIGRKSDAKTTSSNYYVPWTDCPKGYVDSNHPSQGSKDVSGEAEAGYTVKSGTNGLRLNFGEATTTYEYNGIKVYGSGLSYNGQFYSGNGQSVTFTPEADMQISNVSASGGSLTDNGDGTYTVTMGNQNVSITATLGNYDVKLYDTQNNTTTIAANDDHIANVSINGRTLYQDGKWNTLCLPFDMTIAGSPLAGATLKELDIENKWSIANNLWSIDNANGTYQTGLDGETLYLFFKDATEIEAGKPYIIKWASGDNIVSPIAFSNVEIEGAAPETVLSADGKVQFLGNYDPVTLTGGDPSNLYLGSDNKLYYPNNARPINSFRAYFHVDLSDYIYKGKKVGCQV